MSLIRPATFADVPRIVEFVVHFIRGTRYAHFIGIDRVRIANLADVVIADLGVVLLAEHRGEVVGMLALAALVQPLTGTIVVEELAWWVEPEHRGGRHAYRLLCAAEDWTRQNGHSVLKMLAPSDTVVGEMYVRRGYVPIETAYLKQL